MKKFQDKLFGAMMFILVAILPSMVNADELLIHTVSRHTGHNHDSTETWTASGPHGKSVKYSKTIPGYNNENFGLGYRWDSGWTAGMYYNSYRRPTAYLAHDWMPFRNFGAFAGVATGYDNVSGYPFAVLGGLIIRTPLTDKYSMNILVTPPIGQKMDGVMHLTILKKL